MSTQLSDVTPVLNRLRSMLPNLPDALARVAEQVLASPPEMTTLSLVDLADRARVAPATVTRFCRTVGYDDYRALRIAIAAETGRAEQARWELNLGREIRPDDPAHLVLQVIAGADSRTIQETAAQIDLDIAQRAAERIAGARRFDIFGVGGSWLSASEMQLRMERIGIPTWARCDVHSALTSAALLTPDDVVMAISHSGRTAEAVDVLTEARNQGATTIALTSFPRSPIADIADLVLTTTAGETTYRPEALSAKHSQLVVLDLVYILIAQRTVERTTEAFDTTVRAIKQHKIQSTRPGPAERRSSSGT
ncbi:MurR/RpiR family transcriptional regulator [Phytohabitans rumicis]|uniref:MurR/RpiR family transcriptional regulator n=1 Tax=Phytohabitans rumicis TaxID=1076125 RepID=UPI001FEB8408|nr:MurR/RpiR family transcriptional regulator [Phytohabitans rumicis]